MHWLALLLPPTEAAAQQQALAWWALQFTPRVACLEEAVVLEVQSSLRLFGGAAALHRSLRPRAEQAGLSLHAAAWAPSSLGALALARSQSGLDESLQWPAEQAFGAQLDALPLHALSACRPHLAMLARLGLRRLGELRRLPRPALARRFGQGLLLALDRAYGQLAEAHAWVEIPARFQARLELPQRSDNALALQHHAQQLLQQLCAWLAARHAGVLGLTLRWEHDAMRAREIASHGELRLQTAEISRDYRHLGRLLNEHLLRLQLPAPVGEISLHADEILPLRELSAKLLPPSGGEGSSGAAQESITQLLERLALRLGAEHVRCGQLREDHRPEQMQQWQAWPGPSARPPARLPACPQPSWLLPEPLRLDVQQDQPLYQGPLQLLAGPQRIESGWWQHEGQPAQRDYFIALSEAAGTLWIFHERLPAGGLDEQGWFLHGFFA